MKTNKEIKKSIVSDIESKIDSSTAIIVWKYHYIDSNIMSDYRINISENNDINKIYKNRLAKIAFKNKGKEEIIEKLVGPNAFLFINNQNESQSLTILNKLIKDNEELEFVGGYIDNVFYGAEALSQIASLPSKEGLLSMLLSVLQAPMRNLAYSISQINPSSENE